MIIAEIKEDWKDEDKKLDYILVGILFGSMFLMLSIAYIINNLI